MIFISDLTRIIILQPKRSLVDCKQTFLSRYNNSEVYSLMPKVFFFLNELLIVGIKNK